MPVDVEKAGPGHGKLGDEGEVAEEAAEGALSGYTAWDTSMARDKISGLLERARFSQERCVVKLRGQSVAAIVPLRDLVRLDSHDNSRAADRRPGSSASFASAADEVVMFKTEVAKLCDKYEMRNSRDVRDAFGDTIKECHYGKRRLIVLTHGKMAAAIVPIVDLLWLHAAVKPLGSADKAVFQRVAVPRRGGVAKVVEVVDVDPGSQQSSASGPKKGRARMLDGGALPRVPNGAARRSSFGRRPGG